MSTPILASKLFIPLPRPKVVVRARLIERLNVVLQTRLTLVAAPAGFGKTTLLSAWVAGCGRPAAWLSLDEGDNDLARFLTYLVAALQTIAPDIGAGLPAVLQSPQPPPTESILTALLNEINARPQPLALILDDYHVIESKAVDQALSFLLDHLPPQMHLVIATREDPDLPLARLRARGQLSELRAVDLRFTPWEAAGFLNQVMGLSLSPDDISALEDRTEGWIAGLQLAAISLQGHPDAGSFIKSFTGSHHFVLDYLVEEVLQQQPEHVQTFLLGTSILERLCGPLCDAVLGKDEPVPARGDGSGGRKDEEDSSVFSLQPSVVMLEYLERLNLFIVPLDNERRWYRYHHLFRDLLRQRLLQDSASARRDVLHERASQWYEDNDLELEAFQHAAAAHDVARAERLIEGNGMPLHFRGAVTQVLNWLQSLPKTELDTWPSLWTAYASVLLATGQVATVEQKIQAAEAALQGAEQDDKTRDLVGRIAAIRATVATTQNQVETIVVQSRRALEYLHPNNLAFRTSTAWKLGFAYHLQGERAAANQAYTEVIAIGQASGNFMYTLLATIGLGILQEADNQLYPAAQTFQRVVQLANALPLPVVCEAYLGLARICYQWNDLAAALQHVQAGMPLARQLENSDRSVSCDVLRARLKLAEGDTAGAAVLLAAADRSAREHDLMRRVPELAAAQVQMMLHQGNLAAAAQLAQAHKLPLSQARVHLAQGDTVAALAVLEPLRGQMEAKGWADERLKVTVLQAVARHAHGEQDKAVELVGEALAMAEPGGFVRIFVDEGMPMAQLLLQAASRGMMPDYAGKLLAEFDADEQAGADKRYLLRTEPLSEPLSPRELEVLQLIAQGLSNHDISERLFLALSTVKGHNLRIFGKLQVQRRTEAVARARELGLL